MAAEQVRDVFEGEMPAMVLDEIGAEMTDYVDIETYVLYLGMHFKRHQLIWNMQQHSKSFSPPDTMLLETEATNQPIRTAYLQGGALALRIVEGYSSDIQRRIGDVQMSFPELDDMEEDIDEKAYEHLVSSSYCDFGDEGYEDSGDYRTFLDNVIDRLEPDVTRQQFIKRGFGLVMKLMERLLTSERQVYGVIAEAELELELGGGDWDAAFAGELGNNGAA